MQGVSRSAAARSVSSGEQTSLGIPHGTATQSVVVNDALRSPVQRSGIAGVDPPCITPLPVLASLSAQPCSPAAQIYRPLS